MMHATDDDIDSGELPLYLDGDRRWPWLSAERKRALLRKSALVTLAMAAVLLLLALWPASLDAFALTNWVKTHVVLGTLAVTLLFCVAIPLCVPSTVLEMIAGSLFGVLHGLVVILVGKTGGSLLAFLLGRRLGKAAIGGYLARKFPTFRALSDVLNSASWKPLLLFQLSSIPNIAKCYGLAITSVTPWRFAVSSAVGGVPHAILWANIGDQASDIAAVLSGQSEMSAGRLGMLLAGAAITAVAMASLVVYTRRQLHELQKRECRSGSEEETYLLESSGGASAGDPLLVLHSDMNELSKTRTGSFHHLVTV